MGKFAILKIGDGNFEQGFRVTLRIGEDGVFTDTEIDGQLPPAPELITQYEVWQSTYRAREISSCRRLEAIEGQQTNISVLDASAKLQASINDWLNSGYGKFRPVRDRLLETLSQKHDDIRFIIQAEDSQLWRLPWYLWDIFGRYTNIEVALSTTEFDRVEKLVNKTLQPGVRILVILGNSPDIDTNQDLDALKRQLPEADIFTLTNPRRDSLSDELWEQNWDILFFAGHSASEASECTGRIYINQTESIRIEELKYALKKAISHGLRLVIFNSCDGLGLARYLTDLQLPAIIVMREQVPDLVAQKFLEYFLKAFASQKKPLYTSVREARERLHTLEHLFPCASWLPVLCQNPSEVPPTWQELCNQQQSSPPLTKAKPSQRQRLLTRRSLGAVLLASMATTAIVLGLRQLGLLQPLELQAFDHLLRLRSHEAPDPRLLIVSITENDFKLPQQQQRKGSLSDRSLALLLEKLEPGRPRAIGLDIYHDFPFAPQQPHLAAEIRSSDNLITICKVSELQSDEPGIAPPTEIPTEQQGFSDLVPDSDGILRRQLIAMNPNPASPCSTPYAFSSRLAFRYLEAEGIHASYTPTKELQLGKVVFKRLREHMGGYQQLDDWGYQILLNYRSANSPNGVAETVTLKDVLTGVVKPEAVKNRVIIIGVTARSAGDYFATPYGTGQDNEIPGMIVHAQMVSQMLSAVLDGRPLLWVWPVWSEALWIWGWSVIGGIMVFYLHHPWRLGGTVLIAFGLLSGFSFALLIQGIWVPLVPAALALLLTGGSVRATSSFHISDSTTKPLNLKS